MSRSFTTEDGYTLEVHSSMYIDWGLSNTKKGDHVMYSPCALSNESYGFKPADRFEDWDEANEASLLGDDDAFIEWTDAEWVECIEREADELLDAYLPIGWERN